MVFFNVADWWHEVLRRHGETAVTLYVAASFIIVLSAVGFVLYVAGCIPGSTMPHSYTSVTLVDAR